MVIVALGHTAANRLIVTACALSRLDHGTKRKMQAEPAFELLVLADDFIDGISDHQVDQSDRGI